MKESKYRFHLTPFPFFGSWHALTLSMVSMLPLRLFFPRSHNPINRNLALAKTTPRLLDLHAGILAITLGSLILICAYWIFGYSPDYLPVLDTHINRVNTASSIGAAMIITGVLWCISKLIPFPSERMQSVFLAVLVLPLLWLFILSDWQFACPWIVSWEQQKQVINIIKKKVGICSGDTIILADFPRYIGWASVFDGIWDFQSALRINLNRTDINGGVLTDRMVRYSYCRGR